MCFICKAFRIRPKKYKRKFCAKYKNVKFVEKRIKINGKRKEVLTVTKVCQKNELINVINTSEPAKSNKKIFLNKKEKRSRRVL